MAHSRAAFAYNTPKLEKNVFLSQMVLTTQSAPTKITNGF